MTRGEKAKVKREQLEERLRPLKKIDLSTPKKGWLRSIREAIGMTGVQLARRLEISPAAVAQLEVSEANRTISLGKLEQAAQKLGCRLGYVLIPDNDLHDVVQKRARQLLEKSKRRVGHTMDLEGQRTKERKPGVRSSLEESYLILTLPRDFWDDDSLV